MAMILSEVSKAETCTSKGNILLMISDNSSCSSIVNLSVVPLKYRYPTIVLERRPLYFFPFVPVQSIFEESER